MGQITKERRFKSQGLGWDVIRIFLKGENSNKNLKSISKMLKLGEAVSKVV